MSVPARRSKHDPPRELAPAIKASQAVLDDLMSLPPIEHHKPWSDDMERAWVFRTACGTPMKVAGVALGIPERTVELYCSEEWNEIPTYGSACGALLARLKRAEAIVQDQALDAVRNAFQKSWQAAAWYMERRHGWVVKTDYNPGPTTVVNIGQVIIQGKDSSLPTVVERVIDAELAGESPVKLLIPIPPDELARQPMPSNPSRQ